MLYEKTKICEFSLRLYIHTIIYVNLGYVCLHTSRACRLGLPRERPNVIKTLHL